MKRIKNKNNKMKFLNIIVAIDEDFGIGSGGKIPWKCFPDMEFFKNQTQDSVLIMGKNTWESIPRNKRTFEGRKGVVVVSKNLSSLYKTTKEDFVQYAQNIKEAIIKSWIRFDFISPNKNPLAYICGGERIYREILTGYMHMINSIYVTLIQGHFNCDVFFPLNTIPKFYSLYLYLLTKFEKFPIVSEIFEKNINFIPLVTRNKSESIPNNFFKHIDPPDQQYVDLLKEILLIGDLKEDRTGVGTVSIFGKMLQFDLKNGFPLLNRRSIFWRGCFEEALFFLKGKTQTKELEEKGVNIWKGNTSKKFLEDRGLPYEEGDMGPGYGFQWRHFGANYPLNEKEKGVDQIELVLSELKNNPHSRRHLISAWNPASLDKMALPPCHFAFEFYVREDKFLDCMLFQRSCDVMLGLPFNIASYALITHIFARKTKYTPGILKIVTGDTHIYRNHIEAVRTFLTRPCLPFPTLKLTFETNRPIDDIFIEDIELFDYYHFPQIKMEMAI